MNYFINWETNFREILNANKNELITPPIDNTDYNRDTGDNTGQVGQNFTDILMKNTDEELLVDQNSSKGSNSISLEVSDNETNEIVVVTESPKGGKYSLFVGLTPHQTSLMNTDYNQIRKSIDLSLDNMDIFCGT